MKNDFVRLLKKKLNGIVFSDSENIEISELEKNILFYLELSNYTGVNDRVTVSNSTLCPSLKQV